MKRTIATFLTLLPLLYFFFSVDLQAQEDLPIPKFDQPLDKPIQRQTSAALKDAMLRLRKHLCAKPKASSEGWNRRYNELLGEMIVSQHRLVWVVATDLTEQEANILANVSNRRAQIQELLKNAARTKPENAVQIKAILERFDVNHNDFTRTASNLDKGRSIATIYALRAVFSELDLELSARGIEDTHYKGLRNEAMIGLKEAHNLIYTRTIGDIQRRLPSGSKRFALYNPFDSLSLSTFSLAIARAFSGVLKKSYDTEHFSKLDEQGFYSTSDTVEFTEAVGKELFGECKDDVPEYQDSPFQGIWSNQSGHRLAIEVNDKNVNYGSVEPDGSIKKWIPATLQGNTVNTSAKVGCPIDARLVTEEDVPVRFTLSANATLLTVEIAVVDGCDRTTRKLTITDKWTLYALEPGSAYPYSKMSSAVPPR